MAKYHSIETREYRLECMAEWVKMLAESITENPTTDFFNFRTGARHLTKWLKETPEINVNDEY